MAEVRETELPGVGTRFDFTTSSGEPVAVLVHRSGRREIMVYDRDDPDRCRTVLRLTADDTLTLVEVLGASRVIANLAAAQQELAGLAIDWLTVAPSSAWARKALADAAIHTRTGVSIVAIIRGDEAIHAPGADTELLPDDRVVAIGTAEGVAQVERELSGA
jgi:TrkA domain protein